MVLHTALLRDNRHAAPTQSLPCTKWVTLALLALLCLAFYFPVGCAVSSSSSVPSAQQKGQAATSTGVVTPQFFGLVIKGATTQPSIAFGARRLWDAGVTWAELEPAPGAFRWTTLDAEVAAANAAGVELTLTLGMTPTWASSQPTLTSVYGAGATAMPRNLADWDAYVSAVAARYKGRVANYEVWNAPANAACWSGAPAQLGSDMATLSAHASAAIRAIDTRASILSPALDAAGLQQFLAAGGSASVDEIAASFSLAGQAPEAVTSQIASLRNALAGTSAVTKPLWNDQPSWTLPSGGLSEPDQAGYVARSLLLNASFGIARVAWYAWDENLDTALRLTDSNGQPTPTATAYGTVEGWLSGATINGCSANAEQLWSCQLVRGGSPQWILWSTAGTIQASSLGMSTVTDLQGQEQSVPASGLVAVGSSPVLLQ